MNVEAKSGSDGMVLMTPEQIAALRTLAGYPAGLNSYQCDEIGKIAVRASEFCSVRAR